MIVPRMAGHMLSSVAPNCLWKFGWNFGVKGLIAVEKFKARRRRGEPRAEHGSGPRRPARQSGALL
jgi:hypothetical protein